MDEAALLQQQLNRLLAKILPAKSIKEKVAILDEEVGHIDSIDQLEDESRYLLKSMLASGQKGVVEPYLEEPEALESLVCHLKNVDHFYGDFGGIIGYQSQVLSLLTSSGEPTQEVDYFAPAPIDISKPTREIREYAIEGIAQMDRLAEMYAIGGAADRLNLIDSKTGQALPAAKLSFMGLTLLEHMVRDLFAREYLHYKLFGRQVRVPLAMMTSHDKDNDAHVRSICSSNGWFGRDPSDFYFFCQPLVPTFTREGKWALCDKDRLLLKPGGHGVIWKLAHQENVIKELKSRGLKKALIRQINNPIAGVDYGLSAFLGVGLKSDQLFGFASCPRRQNAREGVNVLKRVKSDSGDKWALSNIEYCDLRSDSIHDEAYPANTNILFVDLNGIESAVEQSPYPGVLLNFKQGSGSDQQEIARLELTMQNIADSFEDGDRNHSTSYLTINKRAKTISAAKKAYVNGQPLLETPEGCLLDVLRNAHELLTSCGMELPPCDQLEEGLQAELPFVISYHPALGPFYSIIQQKIRGGSLRVGSEMRLELADLYMENLELNGSLSIVADTPMGHLEEDRVVFSDRSGKAILKGVSIENRGINYRHRPNFVKGKVVHGQQCLISLAEGAEFIAEGCLFKGDVIVRVPANTRCTGKMVGNKLDFTFESIANVKALYIYSVNEESGIVLNRNLIEQQ